jgi:Fur family ferric uptake transcriptional regulator
MEPETIIEQLQSKGHRMTVPRRWIIRVLCEADHHLTVEDVHRRLIESDIKVDEATVYRTLQWLKENEAVSQTDIGQGADVYCLISDQPHHHLICLNCNRIIDVTDDLFAGLRETLIERYRFAPRIDHFAIFGLCEACRLEPDRDED